MAVKYKPFDDLDLSIQLKRGQKYRENQIDFDNASIVNSASRVLKSLNIDDFIAVMVGPDRVGRSFILADQLQEKKMDFSQSAPRYVFFSLPTKLGEHSNAVVIDKKKKKIHIMDSLSETYPEAKKQLTRCIEQGVLKGYEITCASGIQQKDKISCGVHTAANMIELISGHIEPCEGHQLPERSENEVIRLTGLLSTANDDEAVDKQKREKESQVAYRQKATIKAVLSKLTQNRDIVQFLTALNQEIPPDSDFNQRPLHDFLNEFEKRCPKNALNAVFKKPAFNNLLKQFPPLDGKLRESLEHGIAELFRKKSSFEKLKSLLGRRASFPLSSQESKKVKLAMKQIELEIEAASKSLSEEARIDLDRFRKISEIDKDCFVNGITGFNCLEAIKELLENKRAFTEMGYEMIKLNPAQPRLLVIQGLELHIDPYAPLNSYYAHVSLLNGLNSIIDSFISQYERAKKLDLLYEWSSNFLGYCLDGQLESAFNFLQVRDQPKMSLHVGMHAFLSEYARDFAEEQFIRCVKNWENLCALYEDYGLALTKVKQGQHYQMTRSDIKEVFTEKSIGIVEWHISHLRVAFSPSRIAKFMLEKHPKYVLSDDQELTEGLIKSYLKEFLKMEEPIQSESSYTRMRALHGMDTNSAKTTVKVDLEKDSQVFAKPRSETRSDVLKSEIGHELVLQTHGI
ncbi:hypothetical protein [Legionella waltersii]|nr:hypothetical protein [Legionella waltersii]